LRNASGMGVKQNRYVTSQAMYQQMSQTYTTSITY
jgi:hypothetical protein